MKILNLIGARPQIIKAAAISRAVRNASFPVEEIVVHTGQHYDTNMSDVFIEQLEVKAPKHNLNVGSGSHATQTAAMMVALEKVIETEKPDWLVVYGDTNSTLAASITASKIDLPIAHIEAGLRSFNKSMPEEINRIMCDHVSTLLFSPTLAGIENLKNEGFKINSQAPYSFDNPGVFHCGDLMYDNSLYYSSKADLFSKVMATNGLEEGNFILATIHRNANTDNKERINRIVSALLTIVKTTGLKIFWPLHPRTAKMLPLLLSNKLYAELKSNNKIILADPASFFDMIQLEKQCRLVLTDSGGVQKEAYFFCKPCVIIRPETEWIELVTNGCASLADADEDKIVKQTLTFLHQPPISFEPIFGNGHAADFILKTIFDSTR